MLLIIQNNKPVPDSLLNYFAAMDDYRYTLYTDLDEMNQLKYFPAIYTNQADLAKSKLLDSKSYGKPDSVLYLDKLPAEFKSKQGYIYFFKYKEKKDDLSWKLATVGLLPKDPKQFEIKDTSKSILPGNLLDKNDRSSARERYDFTSFTDSKLREDEPMSTQLNRQLKKMLYSRRKSAREFYDVSKPDFDEILKLKN